MFHSASGGFVLGQTGEPADASHTVSVGFDLSSRF